MTPSTLIVGVGSDHGDDQVGWLVARELANRCLPGCEVRHARTPSSLLSWLDDRDRLILCDACRGTGSPGTIQRWLWPAVGLQQAGWLGTHDLSLPGVLSLAAQFGWLPRTTVIWGIEVALPVPGTDVSSLMVQSANTVAGRIEAEMAALCPGVAAMASCSNHVSKEWTGRA